MSEVITPMQMYWMTRLDGIHDGFCFGASVLGVALMIAVIILVINYRPGYHSEDRGMLDCKRFLKWGTVPFFIGVIIATLCPTTKEMAAILVVPRIVNNAKVQALPAELVGLAEDWIKELAPKHDKK